jgi:hypothetical protein
MPRPAAVPLCDGSHTPGALALRYQFHREVVIPDVLSRTSSDVETVAHADDGSFTINPPGAGIIIYNVEQGAVKNPATLSGCRDAIDAKNEKLDQLKAAVEAAEPKVTTAETKVARLEALLASRQKDAAAYAGIQSAASQVETLLKAVDETRTALKLALDDLDKFKQELKEAKKSVDDFPDATRKELKASLEDALYLIDVLHHGAVVKVGLIFVDDSREAVFYDFTARPRNSTLHLQPLGDYPTITSGEQVFAILANVDTKRHPHPFRIAATITAGSVINTEPVRPTFPAGGESSLLAERTTPVDDHAFRDIVLPIRDSVPPNGIAEVTILTERESTADPKKLETVTLVEKAKYPQFRARYRYNFTSGVFRSSLRATSFTKVKIQDDDPTTEKVNEARYRTDNHEEDPTIQPVFAVSYYIAPLDVQSRVGWREWLPAPTLGFAFVKPHENVYVGFSHEPWRNVQVFWGWHYGMETELVDRNEVSESQDATAPITRDRRKARFAWGLSFNVAVIAKVFK